MWRIHLTTPPPRPAPTFNQGAERPALSPRAPEGAGRDSRVGEVDFAASLVKFAVGKLSAAAEAAGPLPTCADIERIVRAHAPVLVFHPDEKYFPADPSQYIQYAELRRHRTILPDEKLAGLGEADPARLSELDESHFLDADNFLSRSLGHVPDAAATSPTPINYQVDQGPPFKVTYHVFYAYNDGPLSQNHEGDWERVTIEFKQSRAAGGAVGYEPDRVILSAHRGSSSVAWQDAEKDANGRLLVYVAKGSHANYLSPGNEPTVYDAQPLSYPYQKFVSPQDAAGQAVESLTDDETARDVNGDGRVDLGDGADLMELAQSPLLDVRQQPWYPKQGGGFHWGERGSALNVAYRDDFSGPPGPSEEKGAP